jgi:hypothetical protein
MTNPTEFEAEIFLAWDETGSYAVSITKEDAIEKLQEAGDGETSADIGVMIRVKRYVVPIYLPQVEEAGELDPAI